MKKLLPQKKKIAFWVSREFPSIRLEKSTRGNEKLAVMVIVRNSLTEENHNFSIRAETNSVVFIPA